MVYRWYLREERINEEEKEDHSTMPREMNRAAREEKPTVDAGKEYQRRGTPLSMQPKVD